MIYLDNAATSFPKPLCVATEISKCINSYCGNPGRSGHKMSVLASEKIYECRELLSAFFGNESPEKVVFTLNTTYAINIAINALYSPNSHVLISNMEHNSVLRPIYELEKQGKISYDKFNVLQTSDKIICELESKVKENTKMIIMTHASNIIGEVFPIEKVGNFCKKHNIVFIVDAAQSAGSVKIDMKKFNINALCAPAHKGLYGPQGLGFVIFRDVDVKRPFILGGNGVNSLSQEMGTALPEGFEAGTMATPLVAGLCASLKWIKKTGIDKINSHEISLANKLADNLSNINGNILFGTTPVKSGIILFKNKRLPTNELIYKLDKSNVCTRGGFHCSPLAHNTLGTGDDGAVRISIGFFNTISDIENATSEIYKICK